MLVTLREQLKDPLYRKWFAKKPKIRVVGVTEPWKVIVQKDLEGGWAQKLFWEYRDAYSFVADNLKTYYDLTLNSRRQLFQPPVVVGKRGKPVYRLPQLPEGTDAPHRWCPYCRRMSIFKSFTRHHNMPGMRVLYLPRCVVCGINQQAIRWYR